MNPRYTSVATRAFHRCEYCHAPEVVFNFPFEVEHIIPLVRNGVDASLNWALACRSCNLHKWSYVTGIDPLTESTAPLFHPRINIWSEHFKIGIESGEIIGLSSIGRATVVCLQMNTENQLLARKQWVRLGVFP